MIPLAPHVCTRMLRLIVGAIALSMMVYLAGCPALPKPDGCAPMTTRCSPDGVPQTCSQTQRWTSIGRACSAVGATCCFTISPYGKGLYACTHANLCAPEPQNVMDAGAVSSDAEVSE